MSLDEYSSQKISKASEFELEQMLKKFKSQQVSLTKFGGFVAYNFIALSGLLAATAYYVKSRYLKRGQPRRMKPRQLTLGNIVKKGSKIGVALGGLYIAGFLVVGYYMMPIYVFKKYTEIQEALHSFEIKYDPFYQEMMLFRKMRKFGLSDGLISDVKVDLERQKNQLIANKKLKEATIEAIKKSQQIYKSGVYAVPQSQPQPQPQIDKK